ncbi:hypothetical protein C8R43DRAFT_954290 [Mycena crocata]|nr:hypothetical protein C8R43DRAFT_954290 [Mycena crocata]
MASDDIRVAFNDRCKVLSSDVVRFNNWFTANSGVRPTFDNIRAESRRRKGRGDVLSPQAISSPSAVQHAAPDGPARIDQEALANPSCFAPAYVASIPPPVTSTTLASAPVRVSRRPVVSNATMHRAPLSFSPDEDLQRRRSESPSEYVLPFSATSFLDQPSRDALLAMDQVTLVNWVTSCFSSPSTYVTDRVVPMADLPSFCLASIHNAHFRLYVALQVALHRASTGQEPLPLMNDMFDDMHATMIDLVAIVDRCRFDWPTLFLPAAHRPSSDDFPSSGIIDGSRIARSCIDLDRGCFDPSNVLHPAPDGTYLRCETNGNDSAAPFFLSASVRVFFNKLLSSSAFLLFLSSPTLLLPPFGLPTKVCPSAMLVGFPTEISTSILDIVLFDGLDPPVCPSFAFFNRRARVCKVDRFWRELVNGLAHYWVYILLTHQFPVSCIQTFLDRSQSLQLHFRLAFFDYDGDYDAIDVDAQIAVIRPYLYRATAFDMATDEAEVILQIFHHLKSVAAPRIRDIMLAFRFLPHQTALTLDHAPASAPAPTMWFRGNFASLTNLRLNGTLLPFAHYTFSSLRLLHLTGAPPYFSADFTALAHVITSSLALETLILQNLPCDGFPTQTSDVISTSLLTLGVIFSSDGSLDLFLRRCFFPNLKTITIEVKGSLEVASVLACRRLFDSATTVEIANRRTGPQIVRFDAGSMFSILSSVTSLDISASRPMLFTDFLMECQRHCSGGYTTVVPHLASLLLPSVMIGALKSFVQLRGSSRDRVQCLQYVRLRTCRHFGPITLSLHTQRQWLHDNLTTFELELPLPRPTQ